MKKIQIEYDKGTVKISTNGVDNIAELPSIISEALTQTLIWTYHNLADAMNALTATKDAATIKLYEAYIK